MDDDNAIAALEAMGLSIDEVRKADSSVRDRPHDRDSRVCLCGHPVSRHTVTNGVVYCKPGRMECPCKKCRPVIEASDTRKFLRKTSGAGALHALSLGMLALVESNKTVKWIIDLQCDRCKKNDNAVVPVPVTQHGKAVTYATGYDALLCRACRSEI